MSIELIIDPPCGRWSQLLAQPRTGRLLGEEARVWRERTRRELSLAVDRPIVATGHQTLLWHPGILAKYLVVDAYATAHSLPTANLVVDQHAGPFGDVEYPAREADGSLSVRTLKLTTSREDVPMGLHPAFRVAKPQADLGAALPSVADGLERIIAAVDAHADAPNAALQMAGALTDLMRPWAAPMPDITSTALIGTTLGRAMLEAMAKDPRRCAELYNRAVEAVPEGGLTKLAITGERVELPVWKIAPDGRREPAFDSDLHSSLATRHSSLALLPRALLMTALVRLGMCDLFVHGTGGAAYDKAMERWVREWLGAEPAPIAVATATLRLPLDETGGGGERVNPATARNEAHRGWHDPQSLAGAPGIPGAPGFPGAPGTGAPSAAKRRFIEQIDAAPRRSADRRRLFRQLHAHLVDQRRQHADVLEELRKRADDAAARAADAAVAGRRDWAFGLYPPAMIDELASDVRRAVTGAPTFGAVS